MNEKPRHIEHYLEWVDRAKENFKDKVTNPPNVPLDDPAWQTWIREVKQLASKYADALIALHRHPDILKLRDEDKA